jgi:hypothetical protein
MPYTTDLIFDASNTDKAAEKPPRKLRADTDASAIAEAERLLRSSRVVAGVNGDEPPAAGVISKDGQEFVCVIVNPPASETAEDPSSLADPSHRGSDVA